MEPQLPTYLVARRSGASAKLKDYSQDPKASAATHANLDPSPDVCDNKPTTLAPATTSWFQVRRALDRYRFELKIGWAASCDPKIEKHIFPSAKSWWAQEKSSKEKTASDEAQNYHRVYLSHSAPRASCCPCPKTAGTYICVIIAGVRGEGEKTRTRRRSGVIPP